MDIDPRAPTPVYVQLADAIQARIENGSYPKGSRLPSESSLVQESGLARATVRHAIALLRERGLVITAPQRGSWVAD